MRSREFEEARGRLRKSSLIINVVNGAIVLTIIWATLKDEGLIGLFFVLMGLDLAFLFLLDKCRVKRLNLLCDSCNARLVDFQGNSKIEDGRCSSCGHETFSG